ncbi:MAG: PDZ domain-containing protein [Planctomycetes bacterium]|nr:PDZ domain-containing protein [Planctomycetota bacterium]
MKRPLIVSTLTLFAAASAFAGEELRGGQDDSGKHATAMVSPRPAPQDSALEERIGKLIQERMSALREELLKTVREALKSAAKKAPEPPKKEPEAKKKDEPKKDDQKADDAPRKRGYMGIQAQELDEDDEEVLEKNGYEGGIKATVEPDSPAEKAGMEDDDIVVEFEGKKVTSVQELAPLVQRHGAGREAKVVILRNGKKKDIKIKLGPHPQDEEEEEE